MNQGLLIIVLLLLVLLLSCKVFNYCVLKELFVNKENVIKMMDDIYGKENFRVCTEDEKRVMLSSTIADECDNFVGTAPKKVEHFKSYCDSLSESEKQALIEQGKLHCPTPETFQDALPACSSLHEASRESAKKSGECREGFYVPDRCCSPEEILGGAKVGFDCSSVCEGFENECPFKESFATIDLPTVSTDAYRPASGKFIS